MNWHWIERDVLAAGSIPRFEREILALHAQGVRAIITLTIVPLAIFRHETGALLQGLDISHHHVPIPDDHPPSFAQARQLLALLAQLREQRRPVYLHCRAGMGRTGTVLQLYYLAQGYSLDEAAQRVRARRFLCTRIKPPSWPSSRPSPPNAKPKTRNATFPVTALLYTTARSTTRNSKLETRCYIGDATWQPR